MRRLGHNFPWVIALVLLAFAGRHARTQAFDLTGPKVDIHVQRNGKTLPIAEVANLLPGDRLWVHPNFPDSQSAHYVLIVTFLRGSTNPPPPEWFTKVETWNKAVHDEGVFVVVPAEAQQALFFLAPETGGDFSTLRAAVRARPGAFVRATQDLRLAGWDRMRLDAYLNGVKEAAISHPLELKERTAMMARSLGIKVDRECFDKPSEQQAPCLVQHTDGMVLDDANAQSLAQQITSGSAGDLMNQLSYSSLAGGGSFSPYVGAVVDVARILGTIHTAHFQYLPAIGLAEKDTLSLHLNVPPSFRDPKSVLVVALPHVGPTKLPDLVPSSVNEVYCAQKPGVVLEAEGAPLVFATSMAHDLKLHIDTAAGPVDLPAHADAELGGIVLDHAPPLMKPMELTGILRGKWGYDDWEGPHFHLYSSQPQKWRLVADDQTALILDRDSTLHLEAYSDDKRVMSTLCVSSVDRVDAAAGDKKLIWKAHKTDAEKPEAAKTGKPEDSKPDRIAPGTLEIVVPMKTPQKIEPPAEQPKFITVAIHQYGIAEPDKLDLKVYEEETALEQLTFNAGDSVALLKGKRLDEVASVQLGALEFTPTALSHVGDSDELLLNTTGNTNALSAGKHFSALVHLHDDRSLKIATIVGSPRPQLRLRTKSVQFSPAENSPLHLGSDDDLPVNGHLVFFLDSKSPSKFSRTEKVELAATDGSFHTELSLADGSLMLEDAHTALASIDPLQRFGSSAFGPVQIRAMAAEGTTGDWIPLGTLVRLPSFSDLRCPRALEKACLLSGGNLFLIDSVASTADFQNPVQVPIDFTGTGLNVPHPTNGMLYVKLRDDPLSVQTLTLPVKYLSPSQSVTAEPEAAQEKPAAPANDTSAPAVPMTTHEPLVPSGQGTDKLPTLPHGQN